MCVWSWVGKIPWSQKWQPTLVFLLENSMGRGAWQATVHGAIKSRTLLSIHTHTRFFNLALALAPAPVFSCPYLPAPSQLREAQTSLGRGQGSWQTLDALQKLHWQKSNTDIQYQYAHGHTTKSKLTNHLNQLKFLLSLLVFLLKMFQGTTMQNVCFSRNK